MTRLTIRSERVDAWKHGCGLSTAEWHYWMKRLVSADSIARLAVMRFYEQGHRLNNGRAIKLLPETLHATPLGGLSIDWRRA